MNRPVAVPRREWWSVVVAVFAWLGITGWARPLALPDEGRYVGVAWESLRHGDWLVPRLNGLPFFHKPPLFYWITEASLALFGPHVWAARLAPLIGGLLGAISVFTLLYRWLSPTHARATLLTLLAMPLFFVGAQFANLDMLVAGLITATVAMAAEAALRAGQGLPYRWVLAGAYVLAGLGVLAKGLIGIVLPGGVLLIWLAMTTQWRTLRALFWVPGLLLMVAVAAPWFVVMQMRYPGFSHFFFVVQHVQRFAGGGFNNVQPFWFYPALLILATFPALPWLYRGWRGEWKRPVRGPHDLHWLLLIWLAVIVVFFSIPQSKLVGYILPALPPLAGLIAVGWARWHAERPKLLGPTLALSVGVVLGLGAVIAYGLGAGHSNRMMARELALVRQPGDAVIMLERYDYDVPFYARLGEPVYVVEDWADSTILSRDSWRKELWETRNFEAEPAGGTRFESWASIADVVCGHKVAWAIGDTALAKDHPWLAKADPVLTHKHVTLWRLRASAMACPQPGAAP